MTGNPSLGRKSLLGMKTSHIFQRLKKWIRHTQRQIGPGAKAQAMVSAQTLAEKEFLALFALDEVLTPLRNGDVAAARAVLLRHYRDRTSPAWPPFPDRITYLEKPVHELSREELIATADAIVEHRFELVDIPPVILGEKIDWRYETPLDAKWAKRLHRYTWLPVLAQAYAETGDERYTAKFVELILDWIKDNPPPAGRDEANPAWTLMGVGMRCLSWTTAFARFYSSPVFSDAAKLAFLAAIHDHGRFLSLFKTGNNHLLREANGLLYLSIYFPEFRDAKEWQRIALARLDGALVDQVNRDGSHIEVSSGYQWLAVEELEGTLELLSAHDLALPSEDLRVRLQQMIELLAYITRPDGSFPQINDGPMTSQEALLGKLVRSGESLGRNDFIYVGTGGARGCAPAKCSCAFADAGFFVMRSDWSQAARYLFFDAGPYGGGHGHEDKLNFEVYALGQPFIVDPGSYTYDKQDPFRDYFVGSQGHNTVLVDGLSQVRRWYKHNLRPRSAAGKYAVWQSQAEFDYVAATYDEGYGAFSMRRAKDSKVLSDVRHTRHILFVKPDYWLLVDELHAAAPHDYQLLFHTDPRIAARNGSGNRTILTGESSHGGALSLIPAEPHKVTVRCLTGCENPIQGWYSRTFYQKCPATTVIYEAGKTESTTLCTLIYPHSGDADEASIEPVPVSGSAGIAYRITTSRGRDYVLFGKDLGPKQFGPYRAEGIVAGIRTTLAGEVVSQFDWFWNGSA